MNLSQFDALYEAGRPIQQAAEWKQFLEFTSSYFISRGIKNPIVVELGIAAGRQKSFYEQLMGAEHIGIDNRGKLNPDILGDTHAGETKRMLERRLVGRPINLLFIDAGHHYNDVKLDYETYNPLTRNIIAFHDVTHDDSEHQVRILWEEIMRTDARCAKILISQKISYMGIGLIIKE